MKKLALTSLLLAALAGTSSAQVQLADGFVATIGGWDFNGISAFSTTSQHARYNQQFSPYFVGGTAGAGSSAFNTTLYFTTNGATFASARNVASSNAPSYDLLSDGLLVSNNSLGDNSTNAKSILLSNTTTADNALAVFKLQTITSVVGNTGNVFSDINVALSVRNQGSANAAISWSYSLNGGTSFIAIPNTTSVIAPSGTSYSVITADFSSVNAIEGVQNVLLGMNYSETAAGASVFIDNVAFYGTASASAIPEPSSFAALAGLCGLGLAASRRRRSA